MVREKSHSGPYYEERHDEQGSASGGFTDSLLRANMIVSGEEIEVQSGCDNGEIYSDGLMGEVSEYEMKSRHARVTYSSDEESDKERVVATADTVVEPLTMMIGTVDTVITLEGRYQFGHSRQIG